METVKVAQICNKMHNGGGIQNVVIRYFRKMDINKIKMNFIINSLEEGELDNEILLKGGKIHKTSGYYPNIYNNIKNKFRFMYKNKFDVVHIHTTGGVMIIDGIIARLCGVKKIIFHAHVMYLEKKFSHKLLTPFFLIVGTDFWACSKEAGMYFFGRKIIKKDNFKVINNAIDTEEYTYDINKREMIRKEFTIDENFVVGFVGRITEQKNVRFVIDIFEEILKLEKSAILLIVGGGNLEDNIKKYIKIKGFENKVIFCGVRTDISNLMQAIDLLLMPSLYEGLGMVAIEAQAVGLNVLVSQAIPIEANITNNLVYMDLSNSAKEWAIKGISLKKQKNINEIKKQIIKSGYDITNECKKVEGYYLN